MLGKRRRIERRAARAFEQVQRHIESDAAHSR
jgi:hypothetical protein